MKSPIEPSVLNRITWEMRMDKGTLALEFVRVLLSWQVIFGGLVLYFLCQHHQVLSAILQRLSSVSFPGGVKVDMSPYPKTSDTAASQASMPPIAEVAKDQEDLSSPGGASSDFDENFRIFLRDGLRLYRNFIAIDVQMMWNYVLRHDGAYALSTEAVTATTEGEKLQILKRKYKMNDQAIKDHSEVARVTHSSSVRDLVNAYQKALALHEYLFRHHSAHHEPA